MIYIFYLLVGAAAGFAAAWFISKFKFANRKGLSFEDSENLKQEMINLSSELKIKDDRLNMLNENLQELKDALNDKENKLIDLQRNLAGKESDLKHITERLAENKKEVEELQAKFKIEFENLANKILEEKTGKFTEQNKKNLDEILNPLHEQIKDFKKKVEETYDKEAQQRFSLKEEVKRLALLNQQVSEETKNLTNALKGDSKTQGDWGELILENILEKSGLVKDREYYVQESLKDEYGKSLRPDVIVKFPDKRSVIIDSKVSLTAYERYVTTEDKDQKEKALNEHLTSIKNHIKELSEKKYQEIVDLSTLDFVMMFLPIEPSFIIAIQKDPDLWNYAYKKGILLISPTNLIAVLKMVSNFWKNDMQNRNVMEIARQSGALYEKFIGFVNDLHEIEKRLDGAKTAHQNAMKKLSTGKDNLVSKVERIKKLGAKTEKELPEGLLEDQALS